MRIVVTNNGRKVIQEIEDIKLPSINSKSHNNIRSQNDLNQNSIAFSTDRKSTYENNIKFIKLNPKKYIIPPILQEKYLNKENDKLSKNSPNINTINLSSSEQNLPIFKSKYTINELISNENKLRLKSSKKKINFNKKIDSEDSNLLSYLKSTKKLNPDFIGKISNYNDDELYRVDKICQIHSHTEGIREKMANNRKKKINWRYQKDSKICRGYLNYMSDNLIIYKYIFDYLKNKSIEQHQKKLLFLERMQLENFK